jgi:hypothetical protein
MGLSTAGANMSTSAKNQELVQKFLASKAFDFNAFGKFIAENGAALASSEDVDFGFIIGNHFIRYCIPPVTQNFDGVDPIEVIDDVAGR